MQLTTIEQCKVGMTVCHPIRQKGTITSVSDAKDPNYNQIEVEFISRDGKRYTQIFLQTSFYPETNLISHLFDTPVFICERIDKTIYGIDRGRIETTYKLIKPETK